MAQPLIFGHHDFMFHLFNQIERKHSNMTERRLTMVSTIQQPLETKMMELIREQARVHDGMMQLIRVKPISGTLPRAGTATWHDLEAQMLRVKEQISLVRQRREQIEQD